MDNLNIEAPAQLWNQVMHHLEEELSSVSIDRWFKNLIPSEITEDHLIVDVPDEFFKNWIEDHYLELILKAIKQTGSSLRNFKLRVVARNTTLDEPPIQDEFSSPVAQTNPAYELRPEDKKLNKQYTFDDYVVGPSNRFAHAASLAVAEQPAKAYNPLFIHGPVGLGKTHLMQSIGHQVLSKNKDASVLYITSEKFTNQLINAIQNRSTIEFRNKYRNVDVLIIDDIQFIAGKEATQEEFFHTFNALYDNHKQIIISSDRSPKDIMNLEERLVSRFEWGLVTDIQKPDFETRSAILRKKAQRHNIAIPDEVTNFIAECIDSNTRELEGALMRVVAYSQLIGRSINIELAQEVLKKVVQEASRRISVDNIQKIVAHYYSIQVSEMVSKRRSKNLVFPRQIAMFLARELTELSLPEIGNKFGGRDHTTVMHSCDKIRNNIDKDSQFREKIGKIKEEIVG